MSEDRDAAAYAAARIFFGGNSIFKLVPIGRRFRFPSNDAGTACIKLNERGWYKMEATGRKFQTGTRTAVVTLDT